MILYWIMLQESSIPNLNRFCLNISVHKRVYPRWRNKTDTLLEGMGGGGLGPGYRCRLEGVMVEWDGGQSRSHYPGLQDLASPIADYSRIPRYSRILTYSKILQDYQILDES